MFVVKEVVDKFYYGQELVGALAVQIIGIGYKFMKGVILRAAGDNDPVSNVAPVWIGDADVTVNTGIPLAPGETLTLPIENCDELYAISTSANQSIAWMGL